MMMLCAQKALKETHTHAYMHFIQYFQHLCTLQRVFVYIYMYCYKYASYNRKVV